MIVYRYEDKDGVGPYRSTNISLQLDSDILSEHSYCIHHPGWDTDVNDSTYIRINESYLAGCVSIDQLNEWFYGFKVRLHKEGFRVKKYVVPNDNIIVGRSRKQVIFKP